MAKNKFLGSLFGRSPSRRRARALMVAGVSSHAGKSWTATAICRHLVRRGFKVAPFKAQNMSLNSFVCADGGEIGRAQVAQAEACGIEPRTDMNPILLKPDSANGSQVIVNGKVWRRLDTRTYANYYRELLQQVEDAYERLASEFDFIVLEGAGGAAEINLRSRDLVNLPLAVRLGIPALLVADIERGGVFASVVGTMSLLEPDEARLVRSFLVNRFRGDLSFFDEGRRMLEKKADRPCLGVFPYDRDIRLDSEDSLSLDGRRPEGGRPSDLKIAIIKLPHISNFTDFRLLTQAEYVTEPTPEDPDLIIIPGTKNTLEDLAWMKKIGLDRWILDKRKDGTAVWGVCGGYQILGRFVADPNGVESGRAKLPALGLLPHQTTLATEKTTRQVRARLELNGAEFSAYEIHMGESTAVGDEHPFCRIDGEPEGCLRRGILGTYLHGAFEDAAVLKALLEDVARWRSKSAPTLEESADKNREYDKLADWFERDVDMKLFEELYLR